MLNIYTSLGTEEVFKLFNGVVLNFDNNKLQGIQKSFYLNGDIKFSSVYQNDLLFSHESYDKNKNYRFLICYDDQIKKE